LTYGTVGGEVPVLLSKDDAFAPTFVDLKFPDAPKEKVKVSNLK
jgi:hypothetical protein